MSDSNPTIVALDQGVPAAKHFAAERAAVVKLADSIRQVNREIRQSAGPVLLSLTDQISFRELSEIMLTAHDAAVPCGFIDSWRGPESSKKHADGLLAWSAHGDPGISFWNSDRTTTELPGSYPNFEVIQHDIDLPEAILGRGKRTLGLITHGNGVDSPFGEGFLCGRLAIPDRVLDNYFPCGQEQSKCIRGTFADGEFRTPRRFASSALSGDIIIWGTCYNTLTVDSIFDPRGGLLAGLIDDPGPRRTRQVITLVRAAEVDDTAVLAACARIEAGETLGSVLTGLNETYLRSAIPGAYPPWILFGDPTIRIVADRSVSWSRDGSVVPPGLSLFELPPHIEHAEAILLVKDLAGVPADLWFHRVGRERVALLLRRDDGPAITVTSASPGPGELKLLRRQLTSVGRLTFSDMLFRLVAANTSFDYGLEAAGRIQGFLQELKWLQLSSHPYEYLSGDTDRLTKLLSTRSEDWRRMNTDMFRLLVAVMHDHGNVLDHHYGFVPRSLAESTVAFCPFCGSPAEISVIRFPESISARQNMRCGRCTIVYDTDPAYGPAILYGPDAVVAGQTAEYCLQLATTPEYGVEFGCARLFAQRPPWPFADVGPFAVIEDSADTYTISLQWTPPADAQPGRYYLIAPTVIDGTILMARRPVLISSAGSKVKKRIDRREFSVETIVRDGRRVLNSIN